MAGFIRKPERYTWRNRIRYQADTRPYVYGMRIYLKDGYKPMAELAFGDGGRPNGETKIIEWDDVNERNKYVINSYTFVWDERETVKNFSFEQFKNQNRRA